MLATLTILLPLFALIALGYFARRRNLLDGNAGSALNAFVVWLALPGLLFEVTATSSWSQLWQPGFIVAFGLPTLLVFAAVLFFRLRTGRHVADASVDAIAASYANTGYVGLPLSLLVFGRSSQIEATIATLIVVCVLFSIAVVLIEVGLQKGGASGGRTFATALSRSLKNPVVLAPLAGAVFSGTGLTLPAVAESTLRMIGQAATPCALVSLGLFLADRPKDSPTLARAPLALSAVKLIVVPLLTWVFADLVLRLPTRTVQCAVLLAALPTGTGPFMLAEFYRREVGAASAATLITTVMSLGTLTALLMWMA